MADFSNIPADVRGDNLEEDAPDRDAVLAALAALSAEDDAVTDLAASTVGDTFPYGWGQADLPHWVDPTYGDGGPPW